MDQGVRRRYGLSSHVFQLAPLEQGLDQSPSLLPERPVSGEETGPHNLLHQPIVVRVLRIVADPFVEHLKYVIGMAQDEVLVPGDLKPRDGSVLARKSVNEVQLTLRQ